MLPVLSVSQFRKAYQGRLVLSVAEVYFQPGIHWLKGRNGSGKTTFFRAVAGLIPFDGQLVLNNQYDIHRHAVDYRLRINYGEAEPLYPELLTGWELIQWVGTTKKAPTAQVDKLIDAFAIGSFLKTPVGTYSSGMLKKLSLVLAFLGNPQLILLDEPLITLDTQATQTVLNLVKTYRQREVSFLLSSHQDFNETGLPVEQIWQVGQQTLTTVPQPA